MKNEKTFIDVGYAVFHYVNAQGEQIKQFGVYFSENLAKTQRNYRVVNLRCYTNFEFKIATERHRGFQQAIAQWTINGDLPVEICEVVKKDIPKKSTTILKLVHNKDKKE